MNKAIEKYIYAVTRRCDVDKRDEIKKELEANIYDMLPENPTDFEIETVLHKLGNPIYVAHKYQSEEKYVVNPIFYQDYLLVLKWGLIGFGLLALLLGIIQALTIDYASMEIATVIATIFASMIENIVSFLLTGFAVVTLIFWAMNQPKAKTKVDTWLNNWKVSELMDVPKVDQRNKPVGRFAILFEFFFTMLFATFFTIAIIFYHDIIGLYLQGQFITGFFDPVLIENFKWLMIATLVTTFIYYLFYLKAGKKDILVTSLYTMNTLFTSIVGFFFINHPGVMTISFITEVANAVSMNPTQLLNYTSIGRNILTGLIIVITTFDILYHWYKLIFKSNKKAD